MRRNKGFTLLEVMVAVAVLALAMAAVIKAATHSGANVATMRENTLAQWVAENRMAELRAEEAWFSGNDSGTAELAGREWFWHIETENTADSNLRRITIRVSADEGSEDWLALLEGFIVNPSVRGGR